MAINCYFQISTCGQLVEVMSRNVGMNFEFFCDLGSSDT
jgi:hypothetical protein